MMVTPVLTACLLGAQVSFSADAVTVAEFVKALSQQTGARLEVDGSVGRMPVTVQVEQRPLEEVLHTLAWVADAQWETRREVRRLARPSELRTRMEREETKQVEELLAAQIAEALAEFAERRALDAYEADRILDRARLNDLSPYAQLAELERLVRSDPARRAAIELLAAAGASRLARMRTGERLVLSDRPTAVQEPLPPRANPVLERLKKETSLLLDARARLADPRSAGNTFGQLVNVGPGTLEAGYGKCLLAVRRVSLTRFNLWLVILDGDRKPLISGSTELVERLREMMAATYPFKGPELAISERQRQFAWLRRDIGYAATSSWSWAAPAGGRMAMVSFGISMAESEGRPPDLGVGDWLADPVGNEPMGLLFGPFVRQLTATQGRSLIASISDASIVALMAALAGEQIRTQDGLQSFLFQLQTPEGRRVPHVRQMQQEGWLALKPWLPFSAVRQRIDRVALRNLLRAMRDEGALLLRDAAAYLRSTSDPPEIATLDTMIVIHAVPEVDRQSAEAIRFEALPFLGSMNDAQWSRYRQGVTFRDLTPEQRECVRRWVYDSARAGRGPSGMDWSIEQEPTERWPNGLLADTGVLLEVVEEPAVQVRAKSGYRFSLSPEELGFQESKGQVGELLGKPFVREFVGYRPAVRSLFTIQVLAPGAPPMSLPFPQIRPLQGSVEGPRDRLPAAVLERVDAARKAFGGG